MAVTGRAPNMGDLSARTRAIVPPRWALAQSVAVVGVGSGGSLVAWWLAASGFGRLVLVDPDRLEAANVWRHLCGVESLGMSKVEAVKERLSLVNPHCRVTALETLIGKPLALPCRESWTWMRPGFRRSRVS